jgi:ABC-type amino acid transport substrate-binding protein
MRHPFQGINHFLRLVVFAGVMICMTFFSEAAAMNPIDQSSQQPRTTKGEDRATITFSTAAPQSIPLFNEYKSLYTEAFKRLGFEFRLQYHPDARAILNADTGKIDGTCGRVYELNADGNNPNLIRVDETIKVFRVVAFTLDRKISVDGWTSLKGERVTYVRGNKYIEDNVYNHVAKKNVIVSGSMEHATRMLAANRADIYIEGAVVMAFVKNHPELKELPIRVAGEIQSIKAYPFLHRSNADLVPLLAATLKAMKEDGTFQQIINTVHATNSLKK